VVFVITVLTPVPASSHKEKESMKKVDGFENYSVTRLGQVWSHNRNLWLRPGKSGKGYFQVVLHKDGKPHAKFVHRLVGLAYIENPDNKPDINHKDGNRLNNHFTNLEWVTKSENTQHAYDMGLMKRGEDHNMAKLSQVQVDYIRQQYATGNYTYKRISKVFNVSTSQIAHIVKRNKWANS